MLVEAVALWRFVQAAMAAVGATEREARQVADVLVAADVNGVDSHGVARLRRYVEGVRSGKINAATEPEVVQESPTTAVLDARNGLGQPAALRAIDLAVTRSREVGIGAVTVRRSNHFGIAGYYAAIGARSGMFTMVCTNASPQVAPTHGAVPMLGTNPIAFALPTGGPHPYLFDAATSAVPRGKLERYAREGRPMQEGWAIGPDGQPITDIPSLVEGLKARQGHALLPLGGAGEEHGGHKGYGFGMLVDLLCGPLAGGMWGRHVYGPGEAGLGHFFLCVRVDLLRPIAEFQQAAGAMIDDLKAAPTVPGGRIFIPGEKEYEAAEHRRRYGVPLLPPVVADLGDIASSLSLAPIRPKVVAAPPDRVVAASGETGQRRADRN